jgi:hypothetical protein
MEFPVWIEIKATHTRAKEMFTSQNVDIGPLAGTGEVQ